MENSSTIELEYKNPEVKDDAETRTMLAGLYADKHVREYFLNERNKYIKELKNIRTGTLEGDALLLARLNGRIEQVEQLLVVMKLHFVNLHKHDKAYAEKKESDAERWLQPEQTEADR